MKNFSLTTGFIFLVLYKVLHLSDATVTNLKFNSSQHNQKPHQATGEYLK